MFLLIAAIGREIVRFGNNAFNMNDLKVLIKLCRDILAGNHQGRDNQRLYMVADWDMNHFRSLPDAAFVDNGHSFLVGCLWPSRSALQRSKSGAIIAVDGGKRRALQ